ncbi:glutamate--tRNA ligase [Candidatus Parcubacteria bacterium]|nr:MAG: glutamate--tRNA ligase [Candidatus Parcubacteria bacterium]
MNPPERPVRVRLAPSPTGPLHIGTARTALFNWLFARKHGGVFILRIEDTDVDRSEKQFEDDVLEALAWLGLEWDEGPERGSTGYRGNFGPYRQSERGSVYERHLETLLESRRAYVCYCTKEELESERQVLLSQGLPPKYSGRCSNLDRPLKGKEPQSIRFRMPQTVVEFRDVIRGKVKFDAALFGDIIIAKKLESPLYNFAAVVDDHEMNISHVIRGEDHISNTPKQILLQRALGFEEPSYAHIPLILDRDRSKLSKRRSEASLLEYRNLGYLPRAVVNFLALLGWHPEGNEEVFGAEELVQLFDLKRVQKAGAIFNQEKLDWLNKEHMKHLPAEELARSLVPFLEARNISASPEFLAKVIELERPRMKNLSNFLDVAGFFFTLPDYDRNLLLWQNETNSKAAAILKRALDAIQAIHEDSFDKEVLLSSLADLIEEEGRGAVLWPLRVAVSGLRASPDPLEIVEILGKRESVKRISAAIQKLHA